VEPVLVAPNPLKGAKINVLKNPPSGGKGGKTQEEHRAPQRFN